jgi:hypothetical protein
MEKYKIIKPPMRVDRMIIQELKDKGSYCANAGLLDLF